MRRAFIQESQTCKPSLHDAHATAKYKQAAILLEALATHEEPACKEDVCCCRWEELAEKHGDILAVMDPHHSPATKLSYRELNVLIQQFAAGLAELGLTKGDKVSAASCLCSSDCANLAFKLDCKSCFQLPLKLLV